MAIGWAIVSTGSFADARMAPAIRLAEDTQLVAVYSRDKGRAEEFAIKHGAAEAYTSLEELLKDSRIDVVFINSPNFLHAPYTIMAAEAGKNVLVEKPMAIAVDESVDMVRSCRAHGVKLGVGFHLRTHPGHIEARRLISDAALGTVTLAQAQLAAGNRGEVEPPPNKGLRAWWDNPEMMGGAGAMMATGVHGVDLLRFILGQEVMEVAALTDGQTPKMPLDRVATMCLKFNLGALGVVCCGRIIPDSMNDATIYGSNGRIALNGTLRSPFPGDLEVVSDIVNTTVRYNIAGVPLYKREVEAFNRVVREDQEPPASGLDGLRVVQVTVAMIESAKNGKTVKLEPISV